ncbi:SDR family oxidoreductase [Microbispora hainanensis]|uniref:SDR family oxidoreductase n=2 Tax=Microbispora TaxID=2005 RepID=A0ABZ1SV21_9ACTN|nr:MULTISPECIES: SDR family oxidoreductase [Microbispora]NJP29061.1 SDR family oxidoreductase [Microbispora sp. CL1-1]TQS06528.1 SDR family oxidoreductase [Microbispora sp. SCL1-1]
MDLHLTGRTAVVTGASRGIGAAIAEVLAEERCDLHLAARSGPVLEETAERLRSAHHIKVNTHVVDLRDPKDLVALAASTADADILVNNAGDIRGGTIDTIDEETWRQGWDLKVYGYVNLTRLLYAQMKRRGKGVVVNIIGNAGERVDSRYLAGSTGNAALMAFSRALGGNSLADGIRVVGVNPGPVATERMVTHLKNAALSSLADESRYAELTAHYPLGRPAEPREIADLVAFLASDRSGYTSGAVFTVDGGASSSTSLY